MAVLLGLLLFLLAGFSFGGASSGTSSAIPGRHVRATATPRAGLPPTVRRDPCLGTAPAKRARRAYKKFPRACLPPARGGALPNRIP
jgi:hypothetical protein